MMASEVEGIIISGGDLNGRLNPRLDSSAGGQQTNIISKKFTGMTAEFGIMDGGESYPPSKDYTHFSSPRSENSRIDYFTY